MSNVSSKFTMPFARYIRSVSASDVLFNNLKSRSSNLDIGPVLFYSVYSLLNSLS